LFVSISQVIGCEDRLRNDLYCVEWGVKLYSNQPTTFSSSQSCTLPSHMFSSEWRGFVCVPTVVVIATEWQWRLACCRQLLVRTLSLCSATTYADDVALPAFAHLAAVRHAATDWYLLGRSGKDSGHLGSLRPLEFKSCISKASKVLEYDLSVLEMILIG